MIKQFYALTFPRFNNSEKRINRYINYCIYAEYLIIEKLCGFFVKHFYNKTKKTLGSGKTERIIVSMTTIPNRIRTLPIVLKSIFNQTVMPDKVILWITDKIEDKDFITVLLKDEIDAGMEVRFIKDILVHTKYYYAKTEYPDDLIITIDDDILYPENLIENLYGYHLQHPKAVIAARAHEITCFNGNVKPYKKWHMLAPGINCDGDYLFATGAGGVLYPPDCFFKDWNNVDLFLKICPTADDIWLKVMELLNGTKVIKLNKRTRELFILGNTQGIALSKQNVVKGRNDRLLKNCMEYYRLSAESFK